MARPSPAAVKLAAFIANAKAQDPTLTDRAIAEALSTSWTSVCGWIDGKYAPKTVAREAIRIWTKDEILPPEWDTPKERASLRRVRPFTPKPGAPAPAEG